MKAEENERRQRAVEEMVAFLEQTHRKRIREKILLSDEEGDADAGEFLARLSAATWKRVVELGANR